MRWKQGATVVVTDPETGRPIVTEGFVCRGCQRFVAVRAPLHAEDVGVTVKGDLFCPPCAPLAVHIERRCEQIEKADAIMKAING